MSTWAKAKSAFTRRTPALRKLVIKVCLIDVCSPEGREERLAKFRVMLEGEPARERICCTKSSAAGCHGDGCSCCPGQVTASNKVASRARYRGAAAFNMSGKGEV